jgi:hypothetical protein
MTSSLKLAASGTLSSSPLLAISISSKVPRSVIDSTSYPINIICRLGRSVARVRVSKSSMKSLKCATRSANLDLSSIAHVAAELNEPAFSFSGFGILRKLKRLKLFRFASASASWLLIG